MAKDLDPADVVVIRSAGVVGPKDVQTGADDDDDDDSGGHDGWFGDSW